MRACYKIKLHARRCGILHIEVAHRPEQVVKLPTAIHARTPKTQVPRTRTDGRMGAHGRTDGHGRTCTDGRRDTDGRTDTDGRVRTDGGTRTDGRVRTDGRTYGRTDRWTWTDGRARKDARTDTRGRAHGDGRTDVPRQSAAPSRQRRVPVAHPLSRAQPSRARNAQRTLTPFDAWSVRSVWLQF